MDEEVKKLKDIIVRLASRLEETEKNLVTLQKACSKTCEEVLALLRDGEHYHRTTDTTELKK